MSSNIEAFIASLPAINDTVKDILSTYDVKIPSQANIKNLVDHNSKPELEQCATYIKTLRERYPTLVQRLEARKGKNKPDYAGDISIFIHGVIEIDCEVCDQQYCQTIAENTEENNLTCYICNRYSHKSCYDGLELKPGIHFICSICSKKKTQNTVSEEPVTEKPVKAAGDEEEAPAAEDLDEDEDNKSDTLCPLLAVGECPHGISGKGCSYKHPKWCWKYQRHGDRQPDGCRRGAKCWYYHPKICENSLKLNVCLNSKCKEHHLEGTRRHQPKNQAITFNQTSNPFNQPGNSFNQPGNSFNQPGNAFNQPGNSSNQPDNLFNQHRQPVNSFNTQSEREFPPVNQQTRKKYVNPWNDESSSDNSDESKMETFLDKYTAKMTSHFASTISTQVNMAVQKSINPINEEIKLLRRSQSREPLQREGGQSINETPAAQTQNQDIHSLLTKYLQSLASPKPVN